MNKISKSIIPFLCIPPLLVGCSMYQAPDDNTLESSIECSSVATAETATEVAQEVTFNANESSVDVIKGDIVLQSLECDYEPDKDKIISEDYDFDGYDDLFVSMNHGAMFAPGTYFRFDPETNLYEKWDELNKIGCEMLTDAENGTLYYRKNNSSYWLEYFLYQWDDDKLVLSEHSFSEDGITFETDEIITPEDAASMLYGNLQVSDTEQHLSYEGTDILDQRCCYIFRLYDDFTSNRVTTGWYAVDMLTGECFDTNVLTELIPLHEKYQLTDNWCEAYKQVLHAYMKSDNFSEHAAFSVYDISDDGIPELIISEGYAHSDYCDVYSFDGALVSLGKMGTYGEIVYYHDKNIIEMYDLGQGYEFDGFYRLENNNLNLLNAFNNDAGAVGLESATYKIDDMVVTVEEYSNALSTYCEGDHISLGSDYSFDEIESVLTE